MTRSDKHAVTDFRGTYLPMITPFTKDGSLDVSGLEANIDWWIAEGVHGLIPAGSAGEFLQLTGQEYQVLVERTVEQTNGRVPVVVGTSADGTDDAVRRTRLAEEAGADGVMVVAPFYSQLTRDELIRHYVTIADSTNLPVMVYNNPETSGVDIQPETIEAIYRQCPNACYVKESTRDVRRVSEILLRTNGEVKVFAGILALESFHEGACGWVSVPGLVVPRLSSELFTLAVDEGDEAAAREVYLKLWDLMALEDEIGKFVQIPKEALSMMGRAGGESRLPRLPLTEYEAQKLKIIISDLGCLDA